MTNKRKQNYIIEKSINKKINNKLETNKLETNELDNISNLITESKISDSSNQAIIFARCSTKKQNEDNLHGFLTQINICDEYAKKNNLEVINILKDTCPGHNIDKLSINEVLKNKENTNIIVADPSRLSRNISDGTNFIERCLEKKIIIHSARHEISTLTTHEKKQFISHLIDANSESKIFSLRIKSTMNIKKKNGSHIGRIPYGKKTVKLITKKIPIIKLIDNINEKEIIELIIMLYFGSELTEFYNLIRK